MATRVVSFRLEESEVAYLEAQGIGPSDFAKEAVARQIQRLRLEGAAAWFRRHPVHVAEPVERTVRRMRDERQGRALEARER